MVDGQGSAAGYEGASDPLISQQVWSRLVKRNAFNGPSPDGAEDHLHSAFVAMQRYKCKQPVQRPQAFLVRTARNLAINDYKRSRFFADAPADSEYLTLIDPAPLPDEVLEHRSRLNRFCKALQQLPPRTSEIFLLHRLEGCKYRDIALMMGISQSAVEKHIAKAMQFVADWARAENAP